MEEDDPDAVRLDSDEATFDDVLEPVLDPEVGLD